MSGSKKAILIGKIAAISHLLANSQTIRPRIKYSKKTNLASHLYLTTQLKQTNELLEALEINLAADLSQLKETIEQ